MATFINDLPYNPGLFIRDAAKVAASTATVLPPFVSTLVMMDSHLKPFVIDSPERAYFFSAHPIPKAIARSGRFRAVREVFNRFYWDMRDSRLLWFGRFGEARVDSPFLHALCDLPVRCGVDGSVALDGAEALLRARAAAVLKYGDSSRGLHLEFLDLSEEGEY